MINFTTYILKINFRKLFQGFFKILCLVLIKNTPLSFYLMLQMLFVNDMVTVPSKKILVNKSKSDIKDENSPLETFLSCPLCKTDDPIITDPKSGEIICSRCGMVVSDKMLERKPEWRIFAMD